MTERCAHWEVCRIAWDLLYCPADKVKYPEPCEYDSRKPKPLNV